MRGLGLLPTRLGCKASLLLAVFLLAYLALPYGNLLFALICWCLVLGVSGAWWSVRNVTGVRIGRCAAPPTAAGTPRTMRLELDVGRRRRCDFTIAAEIGDDWVEILHRRTVDGRATVDGHLPGLPRGIHELRRCRIESRWPFGLLRIRRQIPVAAELITWPAPSPTGNSVHRPVRAADRDSTIGTLRPFRGGDAMRDVHWKATARRGEPVVCERDRRHAVELVVDRHCQAPELERRLSLAAASVLEATALGQAVRLRSHDFVADTGGADSPMDLLRWLAGATALPTAHEARP
ncbi:MAG: DUF58 domain-containing protein [Planctomycetes bacterium]|nr:DUF58 domain-containing protein [Planctomycetota bacterium]